MTKGRYAPTRSVRIDDELWERAKLRAETEGVTLSRVMYLLIEGYARGVVNLPRVQLVYPDGDKSKN